MLKLLIPIWERLALNHLVTGEYRKAETYFLRIRKHAPNRPGILHNLGLVELALRKYPESEALFKQDLELYGESWVRLKSLAELYYIWGKREEAETYYGKALAECEDGREQLLAEKRIAKCREPERFRLAAESYRLFEEGTELMRRKEFDAALEILEQAVSLDETNFQALNNIGVILLEVKQDRDGAESRFRMAAEYTSLPIITGNLSRVRSDSGAASGGREPADTARGRFGHRPDRN